MDPLTPEAPRDPVFNAELNVWELSRYADVLAAFHEPALWPVAPRKTRNLKVPDEASLAELRARVLDAFSSANLNRWAGEIHDAVADLPTTGPLDLVAEFAEPACTRAAMIVTGAKAGDEEGLLGAARIVSEAAAEPFDEDLRQLATKADADLARYFEASAIPMAGPTFVALSRTLACLLGNSWLALLRHPGELAALHGNPDRIPRAIEEMLRYACIPQSVFRHVSRPIQLCGLQLEEGNRLMLRLASANRDPAQFPDPDRFDWSRRGVSHLSLGFGLHSCAGGAPIRMAATAITCAFVERFPQAEIEEPVQWQGGSGFQSPAVLRIR